MTVHDTLLGRPEIRRHHPLGGIGYRNAKGVQVYAFDKMSGDLEPHLLVRFEELFSKHVPILTIDLQGLPSGIDRDYPSVVENKLRIIFQDAGIY